MATSYASTVASTRVGSSPPAATIRPSTNAAATPPRGVGMFGIVCHAPVAGSKRSNAAVFLSDDRFRPPTAYT